MHTGTVKFYTESKGIGIIKEDGRGQEIVVLAVGLTEPIAPSDKVIFDVQEGRKGATAVNVKRM